MACAAADGARTGELGTTEQLKEAWLSKEQVEFGDPALATLELVHRGSYFPLGFPVQLTSNAREVHEQARESWGAFRALFDREAGTVNVLVTEGASEVCPPTPVCRMRGHLVMNVADAE